MLNYWLLVLTISLGATALVCALVSLFVNYTADWACRRGDIRRLRFMAKHCGDKPSFWQWIDAERSEYAKYLTKYRP